MTKTVIQKRAQERNIYCRMKMVVILSQEIIMATTGNISTTAQTMRQKPRSARCHPEIWRQLVGLLSYSEVLARCTSHKLSQCHRKIQKWKVSEPPWLVSSNLGDHSEFGWIANKATGALHGGEGENSSTVGSVQIQINIGPMCISEF